MPVSDRVASSAAADSLAPSATMATPAPAVPGDAAAPRVTADVVMAALSDVTDPEWPVSIVDMGLVYGVAVDDDRVTLTLTFTATACPCMEMIQDDIRERLRRVPGVRDVRIVVSWDPPWTKHRLTEKARRALAGCGVSV